MPTVAKVTDVGLGLVTAALVSSGPQFIGIGTSATAAAVGDTALGTEVETRVSGTRSQQTTTTSNDTYRVTGSISITATRVLAEIGVFTASSAGSMFVSISHDAVNLESGDTFTPTVDTVFDN